MPDLDVTTIREQDRQELDEAVYVVLEEQVSLPVRAEDMKQAIDLWRDFARGPHTDRAVQGRRHEVGMSEESSALLNATVELHAFVRDLDPETTEAVKALIWGAVTVGMDAVRIAQDREADEAEEYWP